MTGKNKYLSTILSLSFLVAAAAVPVAAASPQNFQKEETYTIRGNSQGYKRDNLFENELVNRDGTYLLKNIQYEIQKQEPVITETEVSKIITSNIADGETFTPDETVTEEGVEYSLDQVSTTENTVTPEYSQAVSEKETYQEGETIPETKTVAAVNQNTGETVSVDCTLQTVTESGGTWVDGSIPVTYHNYGADSYSFAGYEIPQTEDKPALAGYEDVIIADAGYDPAEWKITDISWTGDAYDAGGEIRRDALATGYRWQPSYEALYSGEIHTDAVVSKVYTCTYKGVEEEQEEDLYDYTVQATATYQLQENQTEETHSMTKVLIGIGVIAAAVLTVCILLILAARRKEKDKTT